MLLTIEHFQLWSMSQILKRSLLSAKNDGTLFVDLRTFSVTVQVKRCRLPSSADLAGWRAAPLAEGNSVQKTRKPRISLYNRLCG